MITAFGPTGLVPSSHILYQAHLHDEIQALEGEFSFQLPYLNLKKTHILNKSPLWRLHVADSVESECKKVEIHFNIYDMFI